MPPTVQMLGVSAISSFALQRLAPSLLPGLFTTAVLLFSIQFIAYGLWLILLYPRFFSPLRDIPTPPGGGFFLGHTARILRESSGKFMQEWLDDFPNAGLLRYSVWFKERLLIIDPKLLGEVLVTKSYEFVKPTYFRHSVIARIVGIGLLFAEGDEHKRQRKNLSPAFAYRHIKDLYPTFWCKSREMVQKLSEASKTSGQVTEKARSDHREPKKGGEIVHAPGAVDVGLWTSRTTLDIIGLAGMGQDFSSLQNPDNKLNQTYRSFFNPSRASHILQLMGTLLPPWLILALPVKRNRLLREASSYIKQVCRNIIADKRKAMAEKERTDVDIVSVALESGGFSDEDVVNQMMNFLAAGHETTATSMIWAIYLMCVHPEVQAKLREEVRSKLPSIDEEVTAAQIEDCQYLQAVCQEIIRLWSPLTLTMRMAAEDSSIGGHFVPKGTYIIIANFATNTSKQLWGPDAREFKPERWLDADGRMNHMGGAGSNYSFLTFLHGPHSCMGQKFAMGEIACLLAAWVGRFETKLEEGSALAKGEPEIQTGATIKPKEGCWVMLNELKGW